jgi:opacity protein-like surface antigen
MKLRLATAAALVTIAALGSAGAADLPMPAPAYRAPPPPLPVYTWTGCYVGGGGYAMWTQNSFVNLNGTPITASQSNGGNGWFGQGQVGCDYQFTAPFRRANGVNVPITGTVGGGLVVPAGIALNSQKATQFISTELVYRFNWFGR